MSFPKNLFFPFEFSDFLLLDFLSFKMLWFSFLFFLNFYWNRLALHCCVIFCCTVMWTCHLCLCVLVTQLCPSLCDPTDCSPPGSSVHGIFQPRLLKCIAISSSMASFWPSGYQTQVSCVSCIAGGFFTHWAIGQALSLQMAQWNAPFPEISFFLSSILVCFSCSLIKTSPTAEAQGTFWFIPSLR